VKPE